MLHRVSSDDVEDLYIFLLTNMMSSIERNKRYEKDRIRFRRDVLGERSRGRGALEKLERHQDEACNPMKGHGSGRGIPYRSLRRKPPFFGSRME